MTGADVSASRESGTMTSMDLVLPDRIDVVAVEQVEARIRREYGALLELSREAFETSAVAADLERRVAEERVDPDAAFWMFARLHSFLSDLRRDGQTEAAAIEQAARHRAEGIRRRATSAPISLTGALATRAQGRDESLDRCAADANDEIRWSAPRRPTTTAPAPQEAITPAPAPTPTSAPVSDDGVLFGELRALDVEGADGVDEPAALDPGFWNDEIAAPWWRRRRRLVSAGAVLQASAAVVAAAAVAIHFA
jgi:pyruvate/2-oxoglutarate dehydrogenase complex dihydrolipoamide acyltransferase (E2) component